MSSYKRVRVLPSTRVVLSLGQRSSNARQRSLDVKPSAMRTGRRCRRDRPPLSGATGGTPHRRDVFIHGPMRRRTFLKLALGGGTASVLLGSYPVLLERNIVQVNRYAVPIGNLPPRFNGFTLAHPRRPSERAVLWCARVTGEEQSLFQRAYPCAEITSVHQPRPRLGGPSGPVQLLPGNRAVGTDESSDECITQFP